MSRKIETTSKTKMTQKIKMTPKMNGTKKEMTHKMMMTLFISICHFKSRPDFNLGHSLNSQNIG